MKRPKITFEVWHNGSDVSLDILYLGLTISHTCGHLTKKAARKWAKDWCRTVGAALMEKGGMDQDVNGNYYQKPEKGK